uniref:Uncharacterized protein n=1 Tax=Arundo donax TaxID=35708 RepID=A0A0A9BJ44_ARUDO
MSPPPPPVASCNLEKYVILVYAVMKFYKAYNEKPHDVLSLCAKNTVNIR